MGILNVECINGAFIFCSDIGSWVAEDVKSVEAEDDEYKTYLKKMSHFFNKKESEEFKFLKSAEERWIVTKFSKKSDQDLIKEMNKKSIEKAIPGGKYGCALILKHFYPESFENVSLGKMIAMVKKSLEEVKYVHHKTLIYPNQD